MLKSESSQKDRAESDESETGGDRRAYQAHRRAATVKRLRQSRCLFGPKGETRRNPVTSPKTRNMSWRLSPKLTAFPEDELPDKRKQFAQKNTDYYHK